MRMPRLVCSLGAGWLLASLGALAAGPLLPQLADPVALAVREHPRGGVEVVAADGVTGVVASAVFLGDVVQRERTLVEGGGPVTAVGWAPEGKLLVASDGVVAYEVGNEAAKRIGDAASTAPLETLAASPRHVFAVGGGALWRSRRIEGELTSLRRVEGSEGVVGVALDRRGYVAVLSVGEAGVALRFLDPERPHLSAPMVAVEGLTAPIGLAYEATLRAAEPRLYALEAAGVSRLDAADPGRVRASRVVELRDAKSFAFSPDGALYVVAADRDRPAAVVRVADEF